MPDKKNHKDNYKVSAPEIQEENGDIIEGRNAVIEAVRSGRVLDKLYIQEGLQDNSINSIVSRLKGTGTVINRTKKQIMDQMSVTGKHQGVIARCAAYEYSEIEDIFKLAEKRGEDPFVIILDEIEDPHNLGAIIRTANLAGAHGVIISKHRAAGLTAVVAKASAGALNYTPVVKVTNISKTIEELKGRGMWFACAAMDGDVMYKCNLKGSIGLVIGNEGSGVSDALMEIADVRVTLPMKGRIESLNAAVAAAILMYEAVRGRE